MIDRAEHFEPTEHFFVRSQCAKFRSQKKFADQSLAPLVQVTQGPLALDLFLVPHKNSAYPSAKNPVQDALALFERFCFVQVKLDYRSRIPAAIPPIFFLEKICPIQPGRRLHATGPDLFLGIEPAGPTGSRDPNTLTLHRNPLIPTLVQVSIPAYENFSLLPP